MYTATDRSKVKNIIPVFTVQERAESASKTWSLSSHGGWVCIFSATQLFASLSVCSQLIGFCIIWRGWETLLFLYQEKQTCFQPTSLGQWHCYMCQVAHVGPGTLTTRTGRKPSFPQVWIPRQALVCFMLLWGGFCCSSDTFLSLLLPGVRVLAGTKTHLWCTVSTAC